MNDAIHWYVLAPRGLFRFAACFVLLYLFIFEVYHCVIEVNFSVFIAKQWVVSTGRLFESYLVVNVTRFSWVKI